MRVWNVERPGCERKNFMVVPKLQPQKEYWVVKAFHLGLSLGKEKKNYVNCHGIYWKYFFTGARLTAMKLLTAGLAFSTFLLFSIYVVQFQHSEALY